MDKKFKVEFTVKETSPNKRYFFIKRTNLFGILNYYRKAKRRSMMSVNMYIIERVVTFTFINKIG